MAQINNFIIARLATTDLFLQIDNPWSLYRGLVFSCHKLLTMHKENQSQCGPATIMARYHPELVQEFLKKFKAKMNSHFQLILPSKCNARTVKMEPKEPGC